jgi:hypothetical protein
MAVEVVSRWSTLRIWQDTNQDAVGQTSELVTLDTIGIKSISLTTQARDMIIAGNHISAEGAVTWSDNSVGKAQQENYRRLAPLTLVSSVADKRLYGIFAQ